VSHHTWEKVIGLFFPFATASILTYPHSLFLDVVNEQNKNEGNFEQVKVTHQMYFPAQIGRRTSITNQ
jgi:hypothetical protein